MAATFKRVNSVVVDPFTARIYDAYIDPGFLAPAGAYVANLATELNTVASSSQCFRGQPAGLSTTTGKIVPISTAGAVFGGVLVSDLTAYVAARGTKFALVRSGKIRTYAGAALTLGDPVKADTSAQFSGFTKWIAGTDAGDLLVGHAFPLDDGSASNGATPVTTMAQGDQMFVELK